MNFKTPNFQRIFPGSMLPYTFTSTQQYHINMLSSEYVPIPLNVVRTYRIQYLLVLNFFKNFFSKYPPNYNKLRNYEESIFSLHSTLLKILSVPFPNPFLLVCLCIAETSSTHPSGPKTLTF